MPHALHSIQYIKEKIPEPHKQALIQRAIEKGVTYTLKCVYTGMEPKRFRKKDTGETYTKMVERKLLRTKYAGVERVFRKGQEMELPAQVAAFLWEKFCIAMVGGSFRHQSTHEAPFDRPCFEEVVQENRTDLGPNVSLRTGGVASQEDLLIEEQQNRSEGGSRAISDEPTADEIASVAGGAQPAGGSGV